MDLGTAVVSLAGNLDVARRTREGRLVKPTFTQRPALTPAAARDFPESSFKLFQSHALEIDAIRNEGIDQTLNDLAGAKFTASCIHGGLTFSKLTRLVSGPAEGTDTCNQVRQGAYAGGSVS